METNPKIITPNEEARLAYISVTTEQGHDDPSMVVDIGGGSTEVTWGIGHRFDGGRSLKIGTVKLLEGPLKSEQPSKEELDQARSEVDKALMRVTPLGKTGSLLWNSWKFYAFSLTLFGIKHLLSRKS